MTGIAELPNEELTKTVSNSLENVFSTMLSYSIELKSEDDYSSIKPPAPEISDDDISSIFVGSVGFVGDANGVMHLYLQESFANEAAAKITGMDTEDVDHEIVSDVCGELTNMFAGSFKNLMAEIGYDSTLTIPTVLSGDELYISSLGIQKHLRQTFLVNDCLVAADLVIAENR